MTVPRWIRLVATAWAVALAVAFVVIRITHPDMAYGRFIIEFWWWYLLALPPLLVVAIPPAKPRVTFRRRCERAAKGLSESAYAAHRKKRHLEAERLDGKATGVLLALSYFDEWQRCKPESPETVLCAPQSDAQAENVALDPTNEIEHFNKEEPRP